MPPILNDHAVEVGMCINVPANESIELIKSMMDGMKLRLVSQVPLAKNCGGISTLLESFRSNQVPVLGLDDLSGHVLEFAQVVMSELS